jgi:hypothetical protein
VAKKARGYTVPKAKKKYVNYLAAKMAVDELYSFWVPKADHWYIMWSSDEEWQLHSEEDIKRMSDNDYPADPPPKKKRKVKRKT